MIIVLLALIIVSYMLMMYLKKLKFIRYKYIAVVVNLFSYIVIYINYGLTVKLVQEMLLFTVLLIISAIDLKYQIIPNKILIIIGIFGITFNIITGGVSIKSMIVGFFIISTPLLALSTIIKGSIGGGDIKLIAVSGLFLGWRNIVTAFFISSMVSSIILIVLIILKKIKAKDMIPYGPFLSIGIFIASLYS